MALTAGDTAAVLRLNLKDLMGRTLDISGASATIRFKTTDGTMREHLMTVEDAEKGIVAYKFSKYGGTADLPGAGSLYYTVRITWADGSHVSSALVGHLDVRPELQ